MSWGLARGSRGFPRALRGGPVARRPPARRRPRRWRRRGLPGGVSSAARSAPCLQGAGSKQLHVFQRYVLQQIPGFTPSLVFRPSCSLHTPLKGEKQFVGSKCGEWADVKMEGDLERKVPLVGTVPCPKTGLGRCRPLGQRLFLSP